MGYPAADHPLCKELSLQARRAEPDLALKARFLGFRKEVLAAVVRPKPGQLVKLVLAEADRLTEVVLVESRQWREAGAWEDHRRHLQGLRAAALMHLWVVSDGLKLARAHDSLPGATNVQCFEDTWE